MLDRFFATAGSITTKVVETITSEAIKKWVSEGQADTAKKNLLTLYEKMTLLENSAVGYISLLEVYIENERARRDKKVSYIEIDKRWYSSWSRVLETRAEDIIRQMEDVMVIIQKHQPKFEIFLPDVEEFFTYFLPYVVIEKELVGSIGVVTVSNGVPKPIKESPLG